MTNLDVVKKFEPLAYHVDEAVSVSGAGRTTVYEAIRAGDLRAVKNGRRTLILAEDLVRWLSALPAIKPRDKTQEAA